MIVNICHIPRQFVRDKIVKAMEGTESGEHFVVPCGDGFNIKLMNLGDGKIIIPFKTIGKYTLSRMWAIKRLSST